MSKNFNICCPDCFSKDLSKYGKDKTGQQKYRCKTYSMQFTKDSSAKPIRVVQKLIYTMIMNTIPNSNVILKNVIIFMLF